jgi:subtilisin family serine protease
MIVPAHEGGRPRSANRARPGKAATIVAADDQAAMGRRLVSAIAAAALLAVGGLFMATGPAQAASAVSSRAQLTPNPGEWWFPDWQVEQKVWPLAQGVGVTVAVLDTGVQASLPDLRGVVLAGGDMAGGDMTSGGSRGDTDSDASGDGHGTAVAALIAGQGSGTGTVGIAPRARILPVTVGRQGPGSASVVAEAIRFAVGHGAQVINMSFGLQIVSPTACDPVLQAAIAYALERNVILVAAAGDANLMAGPSEPGSCAGVLTVGGIQPDGSLWRDSTREPYVAVTAPADHIVFVGRDGRYSTTAWGTSFSSALVAGAAALIRSRYPHMPWHEVDQRLIDTAIPAGRPVPNDGYGYGIVDLARAVNASAYPVRASDPDPVYARFTAWLATPAGRVVAATTPAVASAASPGGPGMTLEDIVIIGVAAVCVFVAVLVFVLRISSRRRPGPRNPYAPRMLRDPRLVATATPTYARVPGEWEERAASFGPQEDEEYGGALGYGRPPGYGPPPLWTEEPYDPPGWR